MIQFQKTDSANCIVLIYRISMNISAICIKKSFFHVTNKNYSTVDLNHKLNKSQK
ncbi:hypothetical protein SAMN04487930_11457 [Cytophaga hutchinsonii ATCC 33406]|nr:hypothetical protein SAMN04487930_11457 [Cytophaga hutchinsonii ATCC 33406]